LIPKCFKLISFNYPNSTKALWPVPIATSENTSEVVRYFVFSECQNDSKLHQHILWIRKNQMAFEVLVQLSYLYPVSSNVKCLRSSKPDNSLWYDFPNSENFRSAFFLLILYDIASSPENNDCRKVERSLLKV
jgi:hypothetical protein